jgi:hypothetical protein
MSAESNYAAEHGYSFDSWIPLPMSLVLDAVLEDHKDPVKTHCTKPDCAEIRYSNELLCLEHYDQYFRIWQGITSD